MSGQAEEPMLEACTTLGYLAAATQRVRLHALVTSAVYRDPGLLDKMIFTFDVAKRVLGAESGDRRDLIPSSPGR